MLLNYHCLYFLLLYLISKSKNIWSYQFFINNENYDILKKLLLLAMDIKRDQKWLFKYINVSLQKQYHHKQQQPFWILYFVFLNFFHYFDRASFSHYPTNKSHLPIFYKIFSYYAYFFLGTILLSILPSQFHFYYLIIFMIFLTLFSFRTPVNFFSSHRIMLNIVYSIFFVRLWIYFLVI